MGNKRVFKGFNESEINFQPTFKFDLGTSQYDTSEKKRVPSFTDRILTYKNPLKLHDPTWLSYNTYNSYMESTASDHKPVSLSLNAMVIMID
jgi:hypothetical protein